MEKIQGKFIYLTGLLMLTLPGKTTSARSVAKWEGGTSTGQPFYVSFRFVNFFNNSLWFQFEII